MSNITEAKIQDNHIYIYDLQAQHETKNDLAVFTQQK